MGRKSTATLILFLLYLLFKIDSLDTKIQGLADKSSDLESTVSSQSALIEELQSDKDTLESKVEDLENSGCECN